MLMMFRFFRRIFHRASQEVLRHKLDKLVYALTLAQRYCALSKDPFCSFSLTYQSIAPIRLFDPSYSVLDDIKWCARLQFNYRPAIEVRHTDPYLATLLLLNALPKLDEEPATK